MEAGLQWDEIRRVLEYLILHRELDRHYYLVLQRWVWLTFPKTLHPLFVEAHVRRSQIEKYVSRRVTGSNGIDRNPDRARIEFFELRHFYAHHAPRWYKSALFHARSSNSLNKSKMTSAYLLLICTALFSLSYGK